MSKWPAVIITKGIPDHPEGAIRYPRPELRERWQKMGICRLATETDVKGSRMLTTPATTAAAPDATRETPVQRKKRKS